jgi:tetratricopeptide (TPR) repeat protein
MLGEIEFIKHDYENALSLYEKAYKIAENESLGIESRVFMLSRLYYLYHVFNLPGKKQKIRTETEKFGQSPAIPPEGHAFEYSRYIPYNIEAEFSKAVSHSGSDIDSSQYYLERCLAINDCPVVNLYLGDILYQKQDLNALQYYQKAYDAYNADPSYLIRLFYAYFVSVNKTRAEETLNRLKKIDPSNSEIPRLQTLLSALQ